MASLPATRRPVDHMIVKPRAILTAAGEGV